MTRKFEGKFNQDAFYNWLNPKLPHNEIYSRNRLLSSYVEVDLDTYEYFLGMLPPLKFSSSGFAICEATTADIRLAFFHLNGRWFAAHISDTQCEQSMSAVRTMIAEKL